MSTATKANLYKEYFDFMCKLVYSDTYYNKISYKKLLKHLNELRFEYRHPMDKSRLQDGKDFRYVFGYSEGYPNDYIEVYLDLYPCSVLEMMVALAYRVENYIMSDPEIGDRTGFWFWSMIVSLGLGHMDDDHFDIEYCDKVIDNFIERRYEPNGKGGLFTLAHPADDLRNVNIWDQFMWYLNEVA